MNDFQSVHTEPVRSDIDEALLNDETVDEDSLEESEPPIKKSNRTTDVRDSGDEHVREGENTFIFH